MSKSMALRMQQLLLATVLTATGPVYADDVVEFPAGIACQDFALRIDVVGNSTVFKEFTDKEGNVVRLLFAGQGPALGFTNLSSGASFLVKAKGLVDRITLNPDGSTTLAATGHFVVIFFPTDVPAGPSSTLVMGGRVVFTTTAEGVSTLQHQSGKTLDVCAVLSE